MRKIVTDLKIMLGKPTIAGTRITVETILDKLAAGIPTEQILQDYPRLTKQDIRAVLAFASKTVRKLEPPRYDQSPLLKVSR